MGLEIVIMENLVKIITALLLMLIGVLGAWLTAKIGKSKSLQNIHAAQQEVMQMATVTVNELQQTLVDGLKAAHEDGKLTKDEIIMLGEKLLEGTVAKMSDTTYNLLNAAGVDIVALIQGAGESWIKQISKNE